MTDDELIEFATSFRSGILEGSKSDMMCAMVVWPLVTLLNMSGVDCRAIETKDVKAPFGTTNHIWISLDDGRVLDPTADQFTDKTGKPYPPVYLGKHIPALHR